MTGAFQVPVMALSRPRGVSVSTACCGAGPTRADVNVSTEQDTASIHHLPVFKRLSFCAKAKHLALEFSANFLRQKSINRKT